MYYETDCGREYFNTITHLCVQFIREKKGAKLQLIPHSQTHTETPIGETPCFFAPLTLSLCLSLFITFTISVQNRYIHYALYNKTRITNSLNSLSSSGIPGSPLLNLPPLFLPTSLHINPTLNQACNNNTPP